MSEAATAPTPTPIDRPPGDILALGELVGHARVVAARHAGARSDRPHRPLLASFHATREALIDAHRSIRASAASRVDLAPAEEWLLDNFHLVAVQLREIVRHLPRGYLQELPVLPEGPDAGLPRAYALALDFVAQTDARLDGETLRRYVESYQEVAPLTIGELWAIPIMLRLCLVENLNRLAQAELTARKERARADSWADRLAARARMRPADAVIAVAELAESDEALTDGFVARLVRRLRDEEAPMGAAFAWIEERMAEHGGSSEEAIRRERYRQTVSQVSVGNSITSLRAIGALDWSAFFEAVSLVERALRADPAGAYPAMDQPTRDVYRHRVEALARRGRVDELEVARRVCALAAGATDERVRHVGYYLVDAGMAVLEREVGYRAPLGERLVRGIRANALLLYLMEVAAVVAVLAAGSVSIAASAGVDGIALVAIALLTLLPASEVAVSLVNLVATFAFPPRLLPKLALAEGIPKDMRTAVVVPTIISSRAGIQRLLDDLEVRFLANPEPNLLYGLLTDLPDAPSAETPADVELVEAARAGVADLNRRHGEETFFLVHRRRRFNRAQDLADAPGRGAWMGWERKRGKLEQFVELIEGGAPEDVDLLVGEASALDGVRYVVTLDSDTQAPRDSVRRLVGTIAHPLNQPRVDVASGRVTVGYGLVQPRVSTTLTGAGRSLFARILTGNTGLDPYTTAVSDVYQDLFGEGSYFGKGIFDVAAFRAALAGRIPENRFLSHDLFEGIFARTALASDVELLDDFPAHYLVYASRQHRWVRGDWQWLPWLLPRVPAQRAPGEPETSRPNDLPGLGRWKLFDNLRRSLFPPAIVAWLVCGWLLLPGSAAVWTALALSAVAFPIFAHVANALFRADVVAWTSYLRGFWGDLRVNLLRSLLATTLLADQTRVTLDAVGRTLWRLYVTRRNLLEWETAAAAERRVRQEGIGVGQFLARMWPSALGGLVLLGTVAVAKPGALPAAAPVTLLWIAAPLVATWLSRPTRRRTRVVSDADRRLYRRTARKTWRFFETFVTADDNWLPPDNWQEDPRGVLARRTSPTNIGLYLLSVLAARDLGYLTLGQVVERLEDTLDALEKMERYRGHLFNWYDTETLGKLQPHYVSTVDSGNLVSHLVALAQGCEELARAPIVDAAALEGLADELALLAEDGDAPKHERFAARLAELRATPPETPDAWRSALDELAREAEQAQLASAGDWGKALVEHLGARRAEVARDPADCALSERLRQLAARANAFAEEADFTLLYDRSVQLFSIGFNVAAGQRDPSHYDLLASECRVASLWAVARGQVPQAHWFKLGRPLARTGRGRALLAWSGTMFEYLMPALVTRTYWRTLLDETYGAVLEQQMSYARSRGVPWGISESAYNTVDLALNYQYRAFGVPGLGLQPGLAEDLVITPYATALAALVAPDLAAANLRALAEEGLDGAFGFYEAKDYTPSRTPPGVNGVVVRSFMAHHQGMSLVAIDDVLNGDPMVRRFHADRRIRATELLLQERVPGAVPMVEPTTGDAAREALAAGDEEEPAERTAAVDGPVPSVHLLSNGSYSLFVSATGGGASSFKGTALTRWREDPTLDGAGLHLYLRDAATGTSWSTALRPILTPPDEYRATFALEVARFRRVDGTIETTTEVVVSPERPGEIRRVTLVNHGDEPRTLDVTSFAEVALNSQAADLSHPAFGNLFVESWLDEPSGTLLLSRRPRADDEARIWLAHAAVPIQGGWAAAFEHETSRPDFLGRGRSAARPAALEPGARLGGTTGGVLDPCVALRRTVTIQPRRRATIAFVLAAGDSREAVLGTVAQLATGQGVARAFELAWTDARVELRHLGIGPQQAHRFHELASSIIFNDPGRRGPAAVLARNTRSQQNLWAYGISGDNPIVLVRVDDDATDLVHDLLLAHEFWRVNGLTVDLVILNEHPGGYLQPMQDALMRLVQGGTAQGHLDQPGGVFIRRGDQVADEDKDLLQTVARVVLTTSKGRLARQLARPGTRPRPANGSQPRPPSPAPAVAPKLPELEWIGRDFWNGLGGLTEDGREYVIDLPPGATTPAPWVNVVANANFGFVVTESGGGFTWQGNSQTNRLTPWSNDPVVDTCGEAIYLRDEESGQLWSPTPRPAQGEGLYRVRHGQGYSQFEHVGGELTSNCVVFAARDDAAKVWRVRLRNRSARPRRLSATFYAEWVLGGTRERAAPHVVTEWDAAARVLLARNRYADRAGRVAFVATSATDPSFTADRSDFLGRNGSRAAPAALTRGGELNGQLGAGLDPCAALQARVELGPGEEREIVFVLGEGADPDEARRLAGAYADKVKAERALEAARARWDEVLGTLQVETPDEALDPLVNRWLLYQDLGCRFWGRSAFYQSGGAYGFRDQLQDAMAFFMAAPQVAREHILRAAARQFVEGDVQHWWHADTGQGVRTHYTDDLLWLPYVVAAYVGATGDRAILDEVVPFLELRELEPGEHDVFAAPPSSAQGAPLYDHCLRAIERGSTAGPHGLPLMGSGDWNDGMNRVGQGGQGESVWLAWFLARVKLDFACVCESRGDTARAEQLRAEAAQIGKTVDEQAWDGGWYRRAYFDDGTPLGSAENDECRIDAIAQSWSVLAGVGDDARARQALDAAEEHLVRPDDKLLLLLTPPFDRTPHDPGYIKGYLPGVRENGGQYTHGAIWSAWARARLGDGQRAHELFGMLNPLNHGRTPEDAARYKVEPYVVAADVYANPQHVGRGGWTWYTGSAGWLYRLAVEGLLGLRLKDGHLTVDPVIPSSWSGFTARLRRGGATYEIAVENPDGLEHGVARVEIDGAERGDGLVPLADDGRTHQVRVVLGRRD